MPSFGRKPIISYDNFLDFVYANPNADWNSSDNDGTVEQRQSLASGRRSRNPTPWTPGSTADRDISVDLGSGVTKAANCVWLSGGHNYDGEDVTIRYSSDGSAWSNLQANITVGTDGKDLDDGSWCYLFEGTEVERRYWQLRFENAGTVQVSVPSAWFGRMEELDSYFDAPVDEYGGVVIKTGEMVSDRGVKSAAAASVLVRTLSARITRTDSTTSEFTNVIQPWMEHLSKGGMTLAAVDWPNAGARLGLYKLQSPQVGAGFKVRGYHTIDLLLEEVL
jgi:hypothetical protein